MTVTCVLVLLCSFAAASNSCHDEHGAVGDNCLDESASFLQMSKRALVSSGSRGSSLKADALAKTQQVTKITPVDCDVLNKPFQIIKGESGYVGTELNVGTGESIEKFSIPYDKVPGGYENIGGCGINPIDSIIYCSMFAEASYIVRVDNGNGDVEFVARLPYFKPYNAGDFAPSGTFFIGTWYGEFLAVKNLHTAVGCPASNKNCEGIRDLRQKKRQKPSNFGNAADIVAITADLRGNGVEEYIFAMYGDSLFLAKYENETDEFTDSWNLAVSPRRGDNIYGAGWNFQNHVFFAVNSGKGVYQIPLEMLTHSILETLYWDRDFLRIPLARVGGAPAAQSNDGLACINDPNPWVTELQSFDCEAYPGALQSVIHNDTRGYDIYAVDFTGKFEVVYSINKNRTSPAFQMMNALSIGPLDSIVYACVRMDSWNASAYPTPPPFYIVRVDDKNIEFVAKIQALRGSPVAGAFDPHGNFFVISNPSLIKLPRPDRMKGYKSHLDKDLPYYDTDDAVLAVAEMYALNQIADIVAVDGNFDGNGTATWVLGVNAYEQLVAAKVDEEIKYYVIRVKKLNETDPRYPQNLGAAWVLNGEVFFGSNDGSGVYKLPLSKIRVPDGPTVELERVGISPSSKDDNDGLNCLESSSVFWGRSSKFS